jgi:hypothetical protein
MNQNQIIDAMKANREFASQKYQVAYVEYSPDFTKVIVHYRIDSLTIEIDETYAVDTNKVHTILNLWAKQHNAKLMYDPGMHPYLFRVI